MPEIIIAFFLTIFASSIISVFAIFYLSSRKDKKKISELSKDLNSKDEIISDLKNKIAFKSDQLAQFKGDEGERLVSEELRKGKDLKVIDNLILEKDGHKFDVDHILFCRKGVICLESKNYSGEIWVGQKIWRQKFKTTEYEFISPRAQLYRSIIILNTLFEKEGINPRIIHQDGIVVFPNPRMKLKNEVFQYDNLVRLESLPEYLNDLYLSMEDQPDGEVRKAYLLISEIKRLQKKLNG